MMSSKIHSDDSLATFWHQQVQAWQASGKSQKAFCEQQDLSYHRFGYWRKKFSPSAPVSSKTATFVPVTRQSSRLGLSLTLPSGLAIQGIDEDNVSLIGQLLRQL